MSDARPMQPMRNTTAADDNSSETQNHNANPDPNESAEDDEPTRKRPRARVSKACESCRTRKEKCDGARPCCQRCTKLNLTCSYHQGRKRGLRTGYVRGLEILLGLVLNSYPESESLISAALDSDRERLQQPNHADADSSSAPHNLSLLQSWRASAVSDALQKALMTSGDDDDEESPLRDLDAKLTSIFNTQIRLSQGGQGGYSSTTSQVSHSNYTNIKTLQPPGGRSITELNEALPPEVSIPLLENQAVSAVPSSSTSRIPLVTPQSCLEDPLPVDWPRLIDKYIASTHCWLPIIEKYTLFRSASLLTTTQNTHHSRLVSPGEVASLWSALAYSSSLSNLASEDDRSDSSSSIHIAALRLATEHCDVYETGHVHALIVLSLLDIAQGRWTSAWLLIGRAVYTAATLNIIPFQFDASSILLSEPEKRLLRGCFVLDTLVSSRLGFRSYFVSSDLQRVGDISIEGLEEWETWSPANNSGSGAQLPTTPSKVLSVFNALGSIAQLLSQFNQIDLDVTGVQSVLVGLLKKFHRIEEKLLSLDPITQTVESDLNATLLGPPHIVQLRIFAASFYSILCSRIHSNGVEYSEETFDLQSPNIIRAVRLLESNSLRMELINSADAPPTVKILIQLFDHDRALRTDSTARGQRVKPSQRPTDKTIASGLFVSANGKPRPFIPSTSELINPQAEQAGAAFPGGSLESLSTTANQQINMDLAEDRASLTIPSSNDTQPGGSHFPSALDSNARDTLAEEQQEDGKGLNSEFQDDSSLFGQLSALDTFEWPNISEDFMERLGYSRNGDVVDFQSLISFD